MSYSYTIILQNKTGTIDLGAAYPGIGSSTTFLLTGVATLPAGANGIFSAVSFAGLTNRGYLYGGDGAYGSGGNGGIGVDLTATGIAVQNFDTIGGGAGAAAGNAMTAGAGGAGVALYGDTLNNAGMIRGGLGGSAGTNVPVVLGAGGTGGVGVSLMGAATLVNAAGASIEGGYGGAVLTSGAGGSVSAYINGHGAAGVYLGPGTAIEATNAGTIVGGQGAPRLAGAGVVQAGGTLYNTGTVRGGTGGGVGLNLSAGAVHDSGTITGGAAGSTGGGTGAQMTGGSLALYGAGSLQGGAGSGTGAFVFYSSLTMSGSASVIGGVGVNGLALGGTGVELSRGTVTLESGSITGGAMSYTGTTGGTGLADYGGTFAQLGGIVSGGAVSSVGRTGGVGVRIARGVATQEAGTITGGAARYYSGGAGVYVFAGATFTQVGGAISGGAGGALGVGGPGAYLVYGQLVVSGTISGGAGSSPGTTGDAVQFEVPNESGLPSANLVIEPGAVFNGAVVGNGVYGAELTVSGVQAGGTPVTLGTQFTHFDFLNFNGPATQWTVDSTTAALAPVSTTGFALGDRIDLTNLAYSPTLVAQYSGGALSIVDTGTGGTDLTTQIVGPFTNEQFVLSQDSGGGTYLSLQAAACYRRGTLIRTPRGDAPIETLRIGDDVMTLSGVARPIHWIGRRRYSGAYAAGHPDVLPVCIGAGALGEDAGGEPLPRRPLWVSPEHAMWLDGMLIPARALVNGTSITQDGTVTEVAYLHLELAAHDVIFAEGAPSESFVDDDSRARFDNAADYARLYPERLHPERLHPERLHPDAVGGPARFCAPRVEEGFELEAVRRRCDGPG